MDPKFALRFLNPHTDYEKMEPTNCNCENCKFCAYRTMAAIVNYTDWAEEFIEETGSDFQGEPEVVVERKSLWAILLDGLAFWR